jgi:hypothetical protein
MALASDIKYPRSPGQGVVLNEQAIEQAFVNRLRNLKSTDRSDFKDTDALAPRADLCRRSDRGREISEANAYEQ